MNKTLDNLLWDMYAPGTRMEDFLMAPNANQHLPERSYECRDCGKVFGTAQEFSDHFVRVKDSILMTGCSIPVTGPQRVATIERPA